MIDSEQLTAGQKYKALPTTYIIFICPFDPFGLSRHIYTFRNLCIEDTKLELDDKTTKVFVNSTGTADDVSPDVKAFLDYINGVISDDAFVREIDDEIVRVKQIEQERVGYMTYAMKIEEERELAEEKGRLDKTVSVVTNMLKKHYPYAEISEMAETTEEEVIRIAKQAGLAYV